MQINIPENQNDANYHRLWMMWSILNKLLESASERRPYVSAMELRDFVLDHTPGGNIDKRDDVLKTLRNAAAIDQVNRTGKTNKKYFITDIGVRMEEIYRDELLRMKPQEE